MYDFIFAAATVTNNNQLLSTIVPALADMAIFDRLGNQLRLFFVCFLRAYDIFIIGQFRVSFFYFA